MPDISEKCERYTDFYCEELFGAYLNKLIALDDVLLKLDYIKISNQKELFNFLSLILTENYPHNCYNEFCGEKLYFSNTFEYAKEHLNFKLKEFVKIWITPYIFTKIKVRDIKIPFFCCECYKGLLNVDKIQFRFTF